MPVGRKKNISKRKQPDSGTKSFGSNDGEQGRQGNPLCYFLDDKLQIKSFPKFLIEQMT